MKTNAEYLEKPINTFNPNGQVYVFSNENVGEMVGELDLHNKTVLAVCSGGDYVFDAYVAGARRVDTFDVNPNQIKVLNQKSKLIHKLQYHEFIQQFFVSDGCLHGKRKYFGNLMVNSGDPIFTTCDLFLAQRCLRYMSSDLEYNRLQRVLPPTTNFMETSLFNLSAKVNDKYDLILLSNIYDYLKWGKHDHEQKISCMYNDVLRPLANKCIGPNGGDIYFGYLWNGAPLSITTINHLVRYANSSLPLVAGHRFYARQLRAATPSKQAPMDVVLALHIDRVGRKR